MAQCGPGRTSLVLFCFLCLIFGQFPLLDFFFFLLDCCSLHIWIAYIFSHILDRYHKVLTSITLLSYPPLFFHSTHTHAHTRTHSLFHIHDGPTKNSPHLLISQD
ncbi:hypothetical protein QBC43DRAFT_72837 [Cladorrhinum sp. PSN259]|nr:hypothetical protein QBC43DRAFT_72837 [Cladorrhinum sp. PSN259]